MKQFIKVLDAHRRLMVTKKSILEDKVNDALDIIKNSDENMDQFINGVHFAMSYSKVVLDDNIRDIENAIEQLKD